MGILPALSRLHHAALPVVHITKEGQGMTLQATIQALEAGHLTRLEAAQFLVFLIGQDPQRAQQYTGNINDLISSGHIVRSRAGAWLAVDPSRKRPGRPRGRALRQRVTLYVDPTLLAEIDGHALARYLSRNDLILLALRRLIDAGK